MVDLIRESMAGKVAVVIGVGPGQGISTVRMLINFGAKVAIVSRSGNTYGLVESSTIKAYKIDVADNKQLEDLKNRIVSDYGGIDFVISNIGGWEKLPGDFPEIKEFERIVHTNLSSHLAVLKTFSSAVTPKSGSFVLVGASEYIFRGNDLAYNVSKSAVTELVRKSAENLRERGIRVNAVLPGGVGKEDNYYKVFPFNFTRFSERKQLEPIEVAMASVFLASEMALGINGQSIHVDHGLNTY